MVDTTAPEILSVDDLTHEATSMYENTVYLDNQLVQKRNFLHYTF